MSLSISLDLISSGSGAGEAILVQGAHRESLTRFGNFCFKVGSGEPGAGIQPGSTVANAYTIQARSAKVAASATITLAGTGANTVTATINGVNVQTPSQGSDNANATNLAALINASVNALVHNLV